MRYALGMRRVGATSDTFSIYMGAPYIYQTTSPWDLSVDNVTVQVRE